MQGNLQVRNGMVVSPPLSEDQHASLRDAVWQAVPGSEAGDFLVLVRLMHDVLTTYADARLWPVFNLQPRSRSLWREAVLFAEPGEVPAFASTDEEMVLAASNVARWLLGLPQQPSLLPVVFVSEEDLAGMSG